MSRVEDFDFLDFGASNGGSIRWASGAFGGRGLGVDIDTKKIDSLRANGFDGIVGDATRLEFPDNCVSYVSMINFLEHLQTPELGASMIASAVRCAKDFVFVLGPDFESAAYLRELGFKKYFADWSGHTWHHRTYELKSILKKYPDYPSMIYQVTRIYDSYDRTIHPLDTARNSGPYDAGLHPPKSFLTFEQKVFQTIIMIVQKNPAISMDKILTRALGLHVEHGRDHFMQIYPTN